MSRSLTILIAIGAIVSVVTLAKPQSPSDGKSIFRFDTFGDEQLWTDVLQMPNALKTVSPATALSVGLKVDSDALPPNIISAIKGGQVNLNDPAVTAQLLKANSVVGVIGKFDANGGLTSIGVSCALCHSTVDNSISSGIGKRLDGWPNRDLNAGAIIALSPAVTDKTPYQSWGKGKYDPRFHAFDGKKYVELNKTTLPVVLPPAYGLKDVGFETFTGDGPISYWNNYVAVTQMGGRGDFEDKRIHVNVSQKPDLVASKLPALLEYQLSLPSPPPPSGSYDQTAAARGKELFLGSAKCSTCHVPPTYTDVLRGKSQKEPLLHSASVTKMDEKYAHRSANEKYRTTPLRGLWQHPPYFHDGSAADLRAVVNHYDSALSLKLSDKEKADLVEFLKSL
jgi:mono/diheme cytochrome c family protein